MFDDTNAHTLKTNFFCQELSGNLFRAVGQQPESFSFTKRPKVPTNGFFLNLLETGTVWEPVSKDADVFEGRDRKFQRL